MTNEHETAPSELVTALRRIDALGSDVEHSGERHADCRGIARAALATYSAALEAQQAMPDAEPAFYAIHSISGSHIGLWPKKVDADQVAFEYEGCTITPLFAATPKPVAEAFAPRPAAEWVEDYGDVVWWTWRDGQWLAEPAYIGMPLDLGQTVEIELRCNTGEFIHQHQVGGWPGQHTHWTPHPAFPPAIQEGE